MGIQDGSMGENMAKVKITFKEDLLFIGVADKEVKAGDVWTGEIVDTSNKGVNIIFLHDESKVHYSIPRSAVVMEELSIGKPIS